MRNFGTPAAAILLYLFSLNSGAAQDQSDFSPFILKSVGMIAKERSGLGYENYAFTQNLTFGDAGILKASGPPLTMCVAAQMEIFLEALNIYANETKDFTPFHYLPKTSWERLRPIDLRGQIWIVKRAPSAGASDAFANFGMADKVPFEHLTPGSFVNFNRTKTGHGVVFLSYIDRAGKMLAHYSGAVAGFKYFSSQGPRGVGKGGGFGYRWAFFSDVGCPDIGPSQKRDCGVIRSSDQKLLNTGRLRMPQNWDRTKAMEQAMQAGLSAQIGDDVMLRDGEFDAGYFDGKTTDE
jgi:hypothetical protein